MTDSINLDQRKTHLTYLDKDIIDLCGMNIMQRKTDLEIEFYSTAVIFMVINKHLFDICCSLLAIQYRQENNKYNSTVCGWKKKFMRNVNVNSRNDIYFRFSHP